MFRRVVPGLRLRLAILASALLGSMTPPAAAGPVGPFEILSQSAKVNTALREVVFSIVFTAPPDPFTVDELGRPARSFQYEINPDSPLAPPGDPLFDIAIIIRGDEARAAGDLRVRNARGDVDPDPLAGGWGLIRGSVPFVIDGNAVRFMTSFDLLKETDGVFAYRLFTTEFGLTTSLVQAQTIPLPAPVWTGISLLLATVVVITRRPALEWVSRRD